MEMERGSNNKRWGKKIQGNLVCFCGLPAKIAQAWTDQNPGRRFYGCERYKHGGGCNFFQWFDEGEPFGWQKQALIEARDTIAGLRKKVTKLESDLAKKEAEEDIINNFLKL